MRPVILAGGTGRGLLGEPKPLLRLNGTRLIQVLVRELRGLGFPRPVVVVDQKALEFSDLLAGEALVIDTCGAGTREGLLMGLILCRNGPAMVVHGNVLAFPYVFQELWEDNAVVVPNLDRPWRLRADVRDGRLVALGRGDWSYGGIMTLSEDSVHSLINVLAASKEAEYWEAMDAFLTQRWIETIQFHRGMDVIVIDRAEDSLQARGHFWSRLKLALGGE